VRFIALTENERAHLLQVYIMALAAFITGSAMITAYGYGKIELALLSIPIAVILLFLAVLSITLYLIFLRWDASYAYDMATLDRISEKLRLARRMSDRKRKLLFSCYDRPNKEHGFPEIIPLPKRKESIDWALIDEAYGPLVPPSSIRAHPCFNWFLIVCAGGSLSFSLFFFLYAIFKRPMAEMILPGILIFLDVFAVLVGYDIKLRRKVLGEVELFKKFRKQRSLDASNLKYVCWNRYERLIKALYPVLDFILIVFTLLVAIVCLLKRVDFSYAFTTITNLTNLLEWGSFWIIVFLTLVIVIRVITFIYPSLKKKITTESYES
jgi:hypothetical protein